MAPLYTPILTIAARLPLLAILIYASMVMLMSIEEDHRRRLQASKRRTRQNAARVYGTVKATTETTADEELNLHPRLVSTACLAELRLAWLAGERL